MQEYSDNVALTYMIIVPFDGNTNDTFGNYFGLRRFKTLTEVGFSHLMFRDSNLQVA